jgi:hypothetical protein
MTDDRQRVLWYLLLIWMLDDAGRAEEVRWTVERLARRAFPPLTGWQGRYAGFLLGQRVECDQATQAGPLERFLGDEEAWKAYCEQLLATKNLSTLLQAVDRIPVEESRHQILDAVAELQARARDWDAALCTAERQPERWSDYALESIRGMD